MGYMLSDELLLRGKALTRAGAERKDAKEDGCLCALSMPTSGRNQVHVDLVFDQFHTRARFPASRQGRAHKIALRA